VCADNVDVYAVSAFPGARIQVTLTFDSSLGEVAVRLLDPGGAEVLLFDPPAPGSPKQFRFPEMVDRIGVPGGGDYYVEVSTDDPGPVPYDLSVTLVNAAMNDRCFPDDAEFPPNGPHDQPETAMALGWQGVQPEQFVFGGTLCPGDEDWY